MNQGSAASSSRALAPFPGFDENPSAWLSDTLAKRQVSPEFELHARVLPTQWEQVALVPRLFEALQPHVVIHFGVSEGASPSALNSQPTNQVARECDACGTMPKRTMIVTAGPCAGPRRFRLRRSWRISCETASRQGVGVRPAPISAIICYHSLGWAHAQGNAPGRSSSCISRPGPEDAEP